MLAIAQVRHPRYYVDTAQAGDTFDPTLPGEPPGRWLDTEGARFLGLDGRVRRADFLGLTQDFTQPGEPLISTSHNRQVRGWDLTFCAPKSISLLWMAADTQTRGIIEAAHDRAIARSIEYLEREAFGGQKSLIVATFQQCTSREGINPIPDPLLHTHAIALPTIYDRTSQQAHPLYPEAKELYRHKMTAGAIYRAELAADLQQNLDVPLQREKSWFELKGFSREGGKYQDLMNHFSSRRLQIEAENPQNAIDAQKAAYDTRQKKQAVAPRNQLLNQWQETSREYGFGPHQVQKLIRTSQQRMLQPQMPLEPTSQQRTLQPQMPLELTSQQRMLQPQMPLELTSQQRMLQPQMPLEPTSQQRMLQPQMPLEPTSPPQIPLEPTSQQPTLPPQRLLEPTSQPQIERTTIGQKWQEWRTLREAATAVVRHQSHFTHRDLVRAIAQAAQTRRLNGNDVLRLTEKYLASRQVIPLGRIDGDERFANKRLYKLEKQLLAQVRKLDSDRTFRVASRHIRAAADRHHLSYEQTQALQDLTSRGRVRVLQGLSGTGKTHTLAAARQAWERSGYEVLGVSLSGRQAQRLSEQTGIGRQSVLSKIVRGEKPQSVTLTKLFWDLDRAVQSKRQYGSRSVVKSPLSSKTVVVLDNAQAIGVSQMKRLIEEVRRAGGKLVLSGDFQQPQAYQHSGAFKAIARSVGAAELKEVHRQEQTWAQEMVRDIGEGRARTALRTLAERGFLSIASTREDAMEAVVKSWSQRGLKRPHDHLIVAETPEEVRVLNRLAQAKLVAAGNLGKIAVGANGESFRKGDRIKFLETSRTYGVMKNGMGTVRHLDPITKVAVARLDTGKLRAINLRHYKAVELGYAVTTAQAKDFEVRHAYVLTRGMGRDAALVQMSRAKSQTRVFAYELDKEEEAELKLARQMSWEKSNDLAIVLRERERER